MDREKELLERLRRSERRLGLTQTIAAAVCLFLGLLFATGMFLAMSFPAQTASYERSGLAIPVILLLFCAAVVTENWLRKGGTENLEKRKQQVADLIARLRLLREQRPDLLLLHEVSELLEDERARTESRRSFWSSAWFGLFFTLLGFALSYAATKLGWLP